MRRNMFWNEEIETMPREDLEELQLKKLQEKEDKHVIGRHDKI